VKQIDWQDAGGGRGFVDSFRVNDRELLSARV
jgi:hypothetical protein